MRDPELTAWAQGAATRQESAGEQPRAAGLAVAAGQLAVSDVGYSPAGWAAVRGPAR